MRESQIFDIARNADTLRRSKLIKSLSTVIYYEILALEIWYVPTGARELNRLTLEELVTDPAQWVPGARILFLLDPSGEVLSDEDIDTLNQRLTYQVEALSRAVISLDGVMLSLELMLEDLSE